MLRPGPLIALLVLALLAPLQASAVDPNADHELTEAGPITALAMASTSGHVVTGRADPGRSLGQAADAKVWTLWDASGAAIFTGRADRSGCNTITVFDACIGDVTDVAISADGSRLAIAARGNDASVGRVLFIRQSGGAISTVSNLEFSGEHPTSVSGNLDLTQVAVGFERGANPVAGRARVFAWTGPQPGVVTESWETDTPTRVSDIALGGDGRVAAAGGERHYRFSSAGALFTDNPASDSGGTVTGVAFSRATVDHYSVAATTAGEVILYQDDSDVANPAPPVIPQGTSPKRAVAMTSDGLLFAAGDDAGVVRLYRNLDLQPTPGQAYLAASTPALGGAVSALQFSLDGRYLVVGTAASTHLFRTGNSAITEVWKHSGSAVTDVDATGDAATIASASGAKATVFTTLRAASVTPSGNGGIVAGTPVSVTLTVRNTGNREDTITLDAPAAPAGWTATLSRTSFTLAPDATGTALLNVTAPAEAPPGPAQVAITQRQAGVTPSVVTNIAFTVAQRHLWTLEATGPVSRDIDAGQSVTFPFKATNLGNDVDTTTASVDVDRTGWTATVTPQLSAAQGEAAQGEVTLTAPANAGQLESAVVTVRLGADPAASLQLTGTVGARFGVGLDIDPAESLGVPGQASTFTVRLTNTGNVPDTYVLTSSGLQSGWVLVMAPLGTTAIVAPGASADITVEVTPVPTADDGNYAIRLRAVSQGDGGQAADGEHVVRIDEESSTTSKPSKGSPGLEVGLALVALAALAVARRRD